MLQTPDPFKEETEAREGLSWALPSWTLTIASHSIVYSAKKNIFFISQGLWNQKFYSTKDQCVRTLEISI